MPSTMQLAKSYKACPPVREGGVGANVLSQEATVWATSSLLPLLYVSAEILYLVDAEGGGTLRPPFRSPKLSLQ